MLCTAKEAFVKQIAFTNILCTEVSSKLFYSVTNMFFPTNSLDKASKLLFIFVRVHKGYASFQLEAIGYSGSVRGLHCCFSVAKCLKTSMGRQSEESRYIHISVRRKETTSEQSSPVKKFNADFISLLLLT